MAVYAPRDEEIAIISLNTNIDGGGEGDWYNGDGAGGFLKNFFADSVFFGIREGKTGLFAFVPNNSTSSTPLSTSSMDAQLGHYWYLNQFGGNFICQPHIARAAAPYTATAPAAYSAAEDAKVWSAAKVTNARAIIRKLADHSPNARGRFGVRVWLGPNGGDLNPDNISRTDVDRVNVAIARFVQLDRARWEELRGPSAPFKHPGILTSTTMSAQALRGDAGGTFRAPAYLTYNNGEVLNYIDAVACTNHHRNMSHEDGPGLVGAPPHGGINSFYWLWKAIKAGQAAYGAGAPLVPILCTEWGNGLKAGGYVGTPTGDWLTDDLTLNGKNILRTYRMGLAVNALFYWGISLGCYYSLAFSPAELATGSGTELERSRGTNGTQNLFYTSGGSALIGHQPERDFFGRVMDMRRYVLPPDGIIPIPTKTWQLDLADLDNGYHVPYTWAVCATAYNAPDGGSLNVQPWKQWLTVTFPGGGEIVSTEQAVQKIICRPVFLPRHTQWTVKADIMCTGGGLARIAVRGYDLLDGEALTISSSATSVYSTVSVSFRPRGHNLRLPNAARAVIVLHHNGVGVARFKNVVVYPTGTTPPDTGGDPLTAAAAGTPASGAAPLSVTFTGSAAGGAAPYRYRWDFGDGSISTAQNPSHTYAAGGTYTATLTVTDAASATSAAAVTTVATTASLVASASAIPSNGDAPLTVAFTGGATGGTAPYTYAWDFGDGGTSALQSPSHTYAGTVKYTARLTVTDSAAVQATATVAITVTQASTDLCVSSTSNLFKNPCNAATATKRPIGSGATYAGASHQYTIYWLKSGTAAGKVNLNTANSGYGCGIWDASSAAGTFQTTVTYAGPADNLDAKAQFPVTLRLPNGFNSSFNGPSGRDNSALIWDGEYFHDFYRLYTVTQGSKYTGVSHYRHAGGGQGHGGNPRGTPASGIWFEGMTIRGHEWNDASAGKCEHMLGIALGASSSHSVGAQLGKTFVWPATSGDWHMATNGGVIPYGTILAIPPPEKGGPNPVTDLGIPANDTTSAKSRLYWQARNYGWVVVDIGDVPVFRCDQVLNESTRSALQTAARQLYPYLRAITNVGATGSNPIGGGSPLAPNCAFNRTSTVAIKSVAYWESQANLDTDLSQFIGFSTTSDSYQYYTLAYSLTGLVSMYRATGLTKYLDRALLYTNNMISNATTQAGGYLGWKSVADGNVEASLREVYPWRYVCQMLDAMADAWVTGSYLAQYNTIKAFTETNIFDKWYSRGVNSNIYRSVAHIASHWATISDFIIRRSSGARVAQATTVRDNIDHAGMPNWNGDSLRSVIVAHPDAAGAAFWKAYFPKVAGGGSASGIPATDTLYGSDTRHGSDVLSWVVEAYDRGYGPWNSSDISKFIALFGVVWPEGDSTPSEYFRPASGTKLSLNPNTGFLKLGRYSRTFQKRMEGLSTSNNMGRWGNMALNAKILGA